ncbi:MAG TPA: hypothetical protein VLR26_14885 [Frankiaceae bacterium]|nr:hypothetical protein [Frankiaceae bacterium]
MLSTASPAGCSGLVAASGPVLLVALIVLVLFWPARRLVRLARRHLL